LKASTAEPRWFSARPRRAHFRKEEIAQETELHFPGAGRWAAHFHCRTSLKLEGVLLMKIAQIAPLHESLPPRMYGGTERVVSYLTEELVRLGHDVTVFASGDSRTAAKLVRCSDMALRLNPVVKHDLPYHLRMVDEVCQRADEFDVLHFHIDLLHFPMVRGFADRTVTTLHGRLDLPDLRPFYTAFPDIPLVSISREQRRPLPRRLNWVGNVHHGLPRDLLPFNPKPSGDYLAFLGRISPEKRPDRAIEIAACRSRSRQRSTRPTRPTGTTSSPRSFDRTPTSSTSARSTSSRRPTSSAMRGRSSSQSTGPSRSAW
jgi:hypothetical protein